MHIFPYHGLNGHPSRCALSLSRGIAGHYIVILSELPDNPGTSIADAIAEIAAAVCRLLKVSPAACDFYEHVPERGDGPEIFTRVLFGGANYGVLGEVAWRAVSDEAKIERLRRLLG